MVQTSNGPRDVLAVVTTDRADTVGVLYRVELDDSMPAMATLLQDCLISASENEEKFLIELADNGGIEFISSAMREDPSNADVQRSGCGLLNLLAFNNS